MSGIAMEASLAGTLVRPVLGGLATLVGTETSFTAISGSGSGSQSGRY